MKLIKTVIVILFFAMICAAQEHKLELYLETGHSGGVSYVGFSADGKILVSRGKDVNSDAKIWNVQTGTELKSFPATRAVLSPDGETLATAFYKDIKLTNLKTGEELPTLKGHTSYVESIGFAPEGKQIVSVSLEQVKIWDAASGREIKTVGISEPCPNLQTLSPNVQMIACGDAGNKLKLLSTATGKVVKNFERRSSSIDSIAFSQDGRKIACGSRDSFIEIWNIDDGKLLNIIESQQQIYALAFSPDGRHLIYDDFKSSEQITVQEIESGKKIKALTGQKGTIVSLAYSPDGKIIVSGSDDAGIKLWDSASGNQLRDFKSQVENISSLVFAPNGKKLFAQTYGKIKIWELDTQNDLTAFRGRNGIFSPDGKTFAFAAADINDNTLTFLDAATGNNSQIVSGHKSRIESIAFSEDNSLLATGGFDHDIKIWNAESKTELKTLSGHTDSVIFTRFSPDNKYLASVGDDKAVKIWDIRSGKELYSFEGAADSDSSLMFVMLEKDKLILITTTNSEVKAWDVSTGKLLESGEILKPDTSTAVYELYNRTVKNRRDFEPLNPNNRFKVKNGGSGIISLFAAETNKLLLSLIALGENGWIVTTPDGRFDTSKPLDQIEGLHWIINDEILNPLSLDVFMRQYYEPNLLQRVLRNEQFNTLPSIAEINRVQPKIAVKEITPAARAADLVDVKIEVQNVTDDVSIRATDKTKKQKFISGVYDLRLFRNGQLVDVSTPADVVKHYNESSAGLLYDEETKIWREANDLKNLKDVKFDADGKAVYTFHNVKLPHSGEKQVEFSAYAFNADRVKSNTDRKTFDLPAAVSSAPRKGRAYLVTIGVNASDNPNYNLRYAANDARKMQETVGARLKAETGGKYSDIVQIPLISDAQKGRESNDARKEIIKGVFSLLAGHREEVSKEVLERISKIAEIPPVEPEDTLIIAFSGHGYADANGIFYLLPADIPKEMRSLNSDALKTMISSDELSLWMRNITAREMMIVVDACHSAAAVQGAGFKPGPMGSRGLGQLAYDKGMKILAATQSDNVALELQNLQQGLLSYVLVKKGIEDEKADTEAEFKKLTSTEWLGYAVKEVPQIYQDILDGNQRGVIIDGKPVAAGQRGSTLAVLAGENANSRGVNLQQPTLFDFRQQKKPEIIFSLP